MRQAKYKYNCQICGKEFIHFFPPNAKNSPKNCSKPCAKEAYRRWQRRTHGKITDELGRRKCRVCNNLFKVADRGQGHTSVTCSVPCDDIYRKKSARDWKRKHSYSKDGNSIGAIVVEDAMFYGGYKEPVTKVTKGFGYYGVLLYSPSMDRIQCHECGEWFRALYGGYKGHLTIHKLNGDEYKEKYELARTTKLISEGVRKGSLERYLKRSPEFYHNAEVALNSFKDDINQKRTMTGKKIRTETRNLRGNCPTQLLEKIKVIADRNNGVASFEDFRREYGGKYQETIRQLYGSWEKACKMANFIPGRQQPKGSYTQIELLNLMKNFYDEHGRTPATSDFSRGYLPAASTYKDRFGTLNEARKAAGIPQLIMVGRGSWLETKNLIKTMPRSII